MIFCIIQLFVLILIFIKFIKYYLIFEAHNDHKLIFKFILQIFLFFINHFLKKEIFAI